LEKLVGAAVFGEAREELAHAEVDGQVQANGSCGAVYSQVGT